MNHDFLLKWMSALLDWLGINSADGGHKSVAASLVVILTCVAFWRLLRYVLLRISSTRHDEQSELRLIFGHANIRKIALTVAVIVFYMLLPLAFPSGSKAGQIVKRMLDIILVWMFTGVASAIVRTVFELVYQKCRTKDKPLKGFMQVLQIIVWCVGIIVIAGIAVGKSPTRLLTGFGASLAVLSFVFKDTILNLVSGILLSTDKMVSVGDWIEMPTYEIDGTVIDMTLNTIKVRNWDNTVSTVTPYALTSGSFRNWQSMVRSGGRRIARSVNIDVESVKFCSDELLQKIAAVDSMSDCASAEFRAKQPRPTNLELFRTYILRHIRRQEWLNSSMMLMVRHLQGTDTGMPLQIYAFTNTTAWVEYENIQSALFEHLVAIAPVFDIHIFQRPSGGDIEKYDAAVTDKKQSPESTS